MRRLEYSDVPLNQRGLKLIIRGHQGLVVLDQLIQLRGLVDDELVELEELSGHYESLMMADDKFEAALIQRDV